MKINLLIVCLVVFISRAYSQSCTLNVNITSSSPAICSGNMVTLTANASSGTPGYTYVWNTGETTASINIDKPGTYSVMVNDNSGCPPIKQNITISAANSPPAPTAAGTSTCPGGTATVTATAPGGQYQWYDAATGGTPLATGASYTTPPLNSTTTYYVETSSGQCTSTRTAVTVTVASTLGVAGATVCSGNVATLSAGGATNYQWTDSGGNLVGTGPTYTTPPLTASATYYVVGSGNGCTSKPTPVTATVAATPPPPAAPGVAICSGSNATLKVTSPVSGVVIDWFTALGGGTSLITSPYYTTPPLNATTTYYVQSTSSNGCVSPRTAVTVTVTTLPSDPVVSGTTVCSGTSATLTASGSGGTYQWFTSATSTTPLSGSNPYQTPVLNTTSTFYVQSVNGSCKSARVAVTVTVNPTPSSPSAAGQVICSGSTATLTATSKNGTFEWYDAATGGNLLSGNATYTTPTLTSSTAYYVQSVSSGCASPRTAVQVSVLPLPQAPTASNATVCSGNNATLVASAAGGGNFEWYDAATGGNLLSSNQVYTTPPLTANATYYVQNTSSSGCASTRTAVSVTVTPDPTQPTVSGGTTICQGSTATLSANAPGGTIQWFDAANGGNLLATGNSYTTKPLSTTTTFYAQDTLGQCSSPRSPVTVNVTNVPTPAFQYSSGTYCPASPDPTPAKNTPGTFSASPAGLTLDPNTGKITIATSALGNYTVAFTSTGICASTTFAGISIATAPNAQFSYGGPYCQDGANPLPTFPAGSSAGAFSAAPAGLVFVNTSTGEINLAQTTPGTYTITNNIVATGSCPANSATNTVIIDQSTTVSAGPNQNVGTGRPVQLNGSFSGGPGVTVQWSGGAGSFSNRTSPTAVYTPAAGETSVTLTLTTFNPPGPCGAKSSTVTITIGTPPVSPTAAGTTICAGSTATVAATAPGGIYQWYTAVTGGTLLSTGAAYTTPPLIATTSYYVQTTINGVASNRTQVTVTVNPVPAPPSAKSDTICTNNIATLTATGSTGTYQWYDAAIGGNLLSTSNIYTTPALITDTAYYVQTTLNGCISSRTKVGVKVNPIPSITSALTASTCSGTALNYTITSDIAANYSWSRAAVPGISNATVTNGTANPINETLINTTDTAINVTYLITPVATGCSGSAANLMVTVYPAVVVTSAKSQTACNQIPVNYTVSFSYPPDSFSWSRGQVNGISNPPVSNQADPAIQEQLTNTTTKPIVADYIFTINSSNCPPPAFDLPVTVYPTAHITSARRIVLCSGTPLSYLIQSDVDSVTFTWSRPATAGVNNPAKTNQTSPTILDTLVNTTHANVDVLYTITPIVNGCPGASFTFIVAVTPPSPTPVANSNSPICLNSTIKLNTAPVNGATFSWTGPNGFSSTLQNPTISNATKANAGNYVLTINSDGCNSLPDTVNVSVDDFPQADAGPNLVACLSDTSVQLNGKISGGTTTGVWSSNGTGKFSPAINQLNAQYIFSAQDKTAGSVVLTLSSTSKDDCNIATSTTTVTFQPLPTAVAGPNQDVCNQDVSVQLNGTATNQSSVSWVTSGSGSFSPSATVTNPLYFPSSADIQNGSVTLTFQANSTVCSNASSQMTITFTPPPTVNAGKVVYVIKGNPTVLYPQVSESNVQYLWTPNVNLNSDTIKNPTITLNQDMTYTLKVTDIRGCVSEDQVLIKVVLPISPPNTFTPNGDGINDTWVIPDLERYPGVTVDIFTRYGQKVYHSDGYGTPWDGTANGQPLPVGVYYYLIDTRYKDEKVAGYITIIR
jgi:gliding motility-associated-like protein